MDVTLEIVEKRDEKLKVDAATNKEVAVRPPTTHHENYRS